MAIKPVKQLVEDAEQEIETLDLEAARVLLDDGDVLFVDIRDIRELWHEGTIPGALHAPRGMLEFWVDPQSPYHKSEFSQKAKYVFFCAAGWRSALATKALQDMGLTPVAHIRGGFGAWKEADLPMEPVARRQKPS
ncbi:rhodanese-like domain-containing protein [Aestuariispira insulae]|uniref:Rhodanese-related sulfurtransferase n=1 Tax=Aestuariispira insulae TaxID=1461337 RepID=A0A3D9HX32_9PROT|nr:rhodanese-like domain-containing protein [Aestuariispira insulae]RED54063.1 rhodanese-related sulfurtransferase [Aestuariispira insulae]